MITLVRMKNQPLLHDYKVEKSRIRLFEKTHMPIRVLDIEENGFKGGQILVCWVLTRSPLFIL